MAGCISVHLAISSNWKVHCIPANKAENPKHRAEKARFLENRPSVLGPRAMAALELVRDALGLDYAGIDFGLSAAGEILFFEANATMFVPPPQLPGSSALAP
jgi:hypothetical protein